MATPPWTCGRSWNGTSRPKLREVRGVTEINSHGGYYKSFEVRPDPERLASHALTLRGHCGGLESNNANAGGGYSCTTASSGSSAGRPCWPARRTSRTSSSIREEDGSPLLDSAMWPRCASRRLTAAGRRDARRPGRGRHRAGDDAHRRKLAARRRAGQGAAREICRRPCPPACSWNSSTTGPT